MIEPGLANFLQRHCTCDGRILLNIYDLDLFSLGHGGLEVKYDILLRWPGHL